MESKTTMRWSDEQWLLAALFPICSLGGLAASLRRGKTLSKIEIASAVLNSGLFGVAVASILLDRYGWDSWRLIFGVSILAGLGGNALLVFGLSVLQRIASNALKLNGDNNEQR